MGGESGRARLDDVVTLTVANGQLDQGVPSQPSRAPGTTYRPALLVGPSKQRIPARTDLLLKYP